MGAATITSVTRVDQQCEVFGVGSLVTLVTKEMSTAGSDLGWPARMVIDGQRK